MRYWGFGLGLLPFPHPLQGFLNCLPDCNVIGLDVIRLADIQFREDNVIERVPEARKVLVQGTLKRVVKDVSFI